MPSVNPAAEVNKAIESSSLIAALKAAVRAGAGARALTGDEIKALKANGNAAADWSEVTVGDGFSPSKVRNCYFAGPVVIGNTDGEVEMAAGVYYAVVGMGWAFVSCATVPLIGRAFILVPAQYLANIVDDFFCAGGRRRPYFGEWSVVSEFCVQFQTRDLLGVLDALSFRVH